jgi:hypothetical protein
MNVIFIDFDGTLAGLNSDSFEDIERRVKLLSEICHEYNAKIVIHASSKNTINEETMEISPKATYTLFLFYLFNKYNVDVYGRTPNVKKYYSSDRSSYTSIWKEDEIRLYLMRHPEIEHFCVIDDDDLLDLTKGRESDLNKVRDHLVKVESYVPSDPSQEGLLPKHKEEVGKVLKKDNKILHLMLKYKKFY